MNQVAYLYDSRVWCRDEFLNPTGCAVLTDRQAPTAFASFEEHRDVQLQFSYAYHYLTKPMEVKAKILSHSLFSARSRFIPTVFTAKVS
jgi:hypothetical protein